jgi:pantoate--beta-alanine ligase
VEVLRTAAALADLDRWRGDRPLVLVPTMGALHEGHLSLVRAAAATGTVVVSIFVNPTQFGPDEDYGSYPRDLEADLALLEPLGVAAVFAPAVGQMYGREGGVTVQPGARGLGLCGGDRPGHFSGVLTVVAKLFGLVRPDIAIFGRKDAQQCLVIGQMVADLHLPVRLVDLPTVRETDGLALSSRNRYLNEDQRRRSLCLVRALEEAQRLLVGGERRSDRLRQAMRGELAAADEIEYAEVRQVPDLESVPEVSNRVLLAVAARVGPARLIDNNVWDLSDGSLREGYLLGRLP